MPPSITGLLDDNALELVAAFLGNLADLPFDGYFVDGVDLALPPPTTVFPATFPVRGTPWHPVLGTPWPQVRGHTWTPVTGRGWRQIR